MNIAVNPSEETLEWHNEFSTYENIGTYTQDKD